MTIFGADMSHYDSPLTARDGLDFYTHKAAEGHKFYRDTEYKPSLDAARALGIPVMGSYFVNHPGTVADQADWWVSIVNADTPWWRDCDAWIWQIDAEKFDYMSRAPNLTEINALGDAICARTGCPASSVVAYAPEWLYGDTLKGLRYRLWASNYGSNPAVPYRQAYPGDTSTRWGAYSGQTPIILQYGSRATIAGQTTCDANAFRGTLAELIATLRGEGDDMALSDADAKALIYRVNAIIDMADTNPFGDNLKPEPNLLAAAIKVLADDVAELKARPAVQAAPVDPAAVKAVLLDPEVVAAYAKAAADLVHADLAD